MSLESRRALKALSTSTTRFCVQITGRTVPNDVNFCNAGGLYRSHNQEVAASHLGRRETKPARALQRIIAAGPAHRRMDWPFSFRYPRSFRSEHPARPTGIHGAGHELRHRARPIVDGGRNPYSGQGESMNSLRAGVGRCDITPAPGTPQGGWGAQTHQRGLGADLPLFATALVVSGSGESVAIVDVDAIGFDTEWTEKILSAVADLTNLPSERIRFSCTHTHSGPNTFRLATITEGLDMVLSYLEGLPKRIASAVWQAQQNLKPVRCAAGSGKCEINVNRRLRMPDGQMVVGRNWNGPIDPTVRVVRFDDLHENPVATIVHYACHPTTMGWQCQYATPDYPGVVRQVVEQQVGGVCLFLQGATGNVTPRRGFTGDLKVYRRLGKLLGLEASKVAIEIETMPRREHLVGVMQSGTAIALYEDEPTEPDRAVLRVRFRLLKLPLRQFPPPEAIAAEAEELRSQLKQARSRGDAEEIRAATARATQAGMRADRARLYHGKTHLDWPLQGIRLGLIALLSIAGEPFTEINQQIIAASPFSQTLFSGYSNGGFGYLPTRSAFAEGGYEVETSPFSEDAAEILVNESIQMLKELSAD